MTRTLPLALLLAALLAGGAHAASMRSAALGGTCTVSLAAQAKPCAAAEYLEFPDARRANVTVSTDGEDALSFSGGELSGTPTTTTLRLDRIIETHEDRTLAHPATGRCTLTHTDDVGRIQSVVCTARSAIGTLRFSLRGDGSAFDLRETQIGSN